MPHNTIPFVGPPFHDKANEVILGGLRWQMRNNRNMQQSSLAALQRNPNFVFGRDQAHAVALAVLSGQLNGHVNLYRLIAGILKQHQGFEGLSNRGRWGINRESTLNKLYVQARTTSNRAQYVRVVGGECCIVDARHYASFRLRNVTMLGLALRVTGGTFSARS